MEVDNCVNITQHYCDITHKVDESCDTFWVKVKALNGLHESDYTYSDRYHVFENGKLSLKYVRILSTGYPLQWG